MAALAALVVATADGCRREPSKPAAAAVARAADAHVETPAPPEGAADPATCWIEPAEAPVAYAAGAVTDPAADAVMHSSTFSANRPAVMHFAGRRAELPATLRLPGRDGASPFTFTIRHDGSGYYDFQCPGSKEPCRFTDAEGRELAVIDVKFSVDSGEADDQPTRSLFRLTLVKP
jgi:hypothetical protein